MTPYYSHAGIEIYCGDCREVMPGLGAVDAVVTDPPYGVDLGCCVGRSAGHEMNHNSYKSYEDSYENFISEIVPRLNSVLDIAKRAAVFTGPHIHEQRKPDAIGGVFCPAAVGRHCWGFKNFLPVLFYGHAPNLNLGARYPTAISSTEIASSDSRGHPVPKPLGWMEWLVRLSSTFKETILDPFMGSGTTLVAAKELGRRAVGIEIEERYCEIAAKRLSQQVFNFSTDEKQKPEQTALPGVDGVAP